MKNGAPAQTGAVANSSLSASKGYCARACEVKPRSTWSRRHPATPSGSVRWGLPNGQKASTGHLWMDPDQAGCTVVGHQCECRSFDHRSGCGADRPGPAEKRCSASGDAYAIHDQCERHYSPGTQSVPRWPFTGPFTRLGSRGEWLTIRAIDKRTLTSPPSTFLR